MTTDLFSRSSAAGDAASSDPGNSHGASPRSLSDFPVLFQLGDVSRPKSNRTFAAASNAVATSEASRAKAEPLAVPQASREPASDPHALRLAEMAKPYLPATLESSTLWSPSIASLLDEPAAPPAASTHSPATDKASKATAETKAAATPKGSTTKPSQPADSPKGKEPQTTSTDRRERETSSRRQPVRKNDWFASHGKLIAVGFVLALAATVVIARNQKKPSAQPANDSWSLKHPGDAAEQLAVDGPKIELPPAISHNSPAPAVGAKTKKGKRPPADKLVEKKRPAGDRPGNLSQVDLLPPTLPQHTVAETSPGGAGPKVDPTPPTALAEKPAPEKPAADAVAPQSGDPLFQWPRQGTRVATRPELPASSPAAAATIPPTQPGYSQGINPGEVLNPYTTARQPAGAPTGTAAGTEGPVATTASRSPYVLPGSPQDLSTPQPAASGPPSAPPSGSTSVYSSSAPPTGGNYGSPATNGGYAPAATNSPGSVYSPAAEAAPAATYSAGPTAGSYGPAPPTTPSPYLPPPAGNAPSQPVAPPSAAPAPSYGAPPAGNPNNQQPPSGYRYERTGSGLY